MTYDQNDQADPYRQIVMPHREPRGRSGRFVLLAGVAGACLLGVGAGLWARPAMNERQVAAARVTPAPAPGPERKLQIVVDDRPAPVSAPIQVLPAVDTARALPAYRPPAFQPPEVQAPRRESGGLIRILAPIFALAHAPRPHMAAPPVAAPDAPPAPAPAPKARPAHRPAVDDSLRLAKADADRQPRLDALAEQRAERKAEQRAEQKAELARADAAKATAAHRIELAKAAKAEHLEQVRLAKAEARGHARALAEAREQAHAEQLARAEQSRKQQVRLAALVRSLTHVLPHKAKPEPPPVLTARLDRRPGHKAAAHEPRIEQVSTRKPVRAPPPKLTHASHPVRPHAEPAQPQPRASGLMKVSSHCASRDPGEAIVCADPNLGAADRQMSRAYQVARAAGVPDSELRQQQQRWLAARSSAAREAPWAVRDVYLARIAELNGQAREAHGDGY